MPKPRSRLRIPRPGAGSFMEPSNPERHRWRPAEIQGKAQRAAHSGCALLDQRRPRTQRARPRLTVCAISASHDAVGISSAYPTSWTLFRGTHACGHPRAQGRCGRCPPRPGVIFDLFFGGRAAHAVATSPLLPASAADPAQPPYHATRQHSHNACEPHAPHEAPSA